HLPVFLIPRTQVSDFQKRAFHTTCLLYDSFLSSTWYMQNMRRQFPWQDRKLSFQSSRISHIRLHIQTRSMLKFPEYIHVSSCFPPFRSFLFLSLSYSGNCSSAGMS